MNPNGKIDWTAESPVRASWGVGLFSGNAKEITYANGAKQKETYADCKMQTVSCADF